MARRVFRRVRRHARRVEDAPRPTMFLYLLDLACRQPRVDYDWPGIEPCGCEENRYKGPAIFADDHHPVTRTHPQRSEPCLGVRHNGGQLRVGPTARRLDQGWMVRRPVRPES